MYLFSDEIKIKAEKSAFIARIVSCVENKILICFNDGQLQYYDILLNKLLNQKRLEKGIIEATPIKKDICYFFKEKIALIDNFNFSIRIFDLEKFSLINNFTKNLPTHSENSNNPNEIKNHLKYNCTELIGMEQEDFFVILERKNTIDSIIVENKITIFKGIELSIVGEIIYKSKQHPCHLEKLNEKDLIVICCHNIIEQNFEFLLINLNYPQCNRIIFNFIFYVLFQNIIRLQEIFFRKRKNEF